MRYGFKARFVAPIQAGLGILPMFEHCGKGVPAEFTLEAGELRPFDPARDLDPPIFPKRQTIRAHRRGRSRHVRPGEEISLWHGPRMKPKLIGRARCTSIEPIGFRVASSHLFLERPNGFQSITDLFARADGFANAGEMRDFWIAEHGLGIFRGVIIRWEPL
jgi:hypothetical protein